MRLSDRSVSQSSKFENWNILFQHNCSVLFKLCTSFIGIHIIKMFWCDKVFMNLVSSFELDGFCWSCSSQNRMKALMFNNITSVEYWDWAGTTVWMHKAMILFCNSCNVVLYSSPSFSCNLYSIIFYYC